MSGLRQLEKENLGNPVNSSLVNNKLSIFFNILLIEDDPTDALIIENKLRESELRPFQLERATSLTEGIGILENTPEINIVLLDLHLPDSIGLDTFLDLHSRFPHVPIIVLTGTVANKDGMLAVEKGAQNFLEKAHISAHLIDSSIRFAIARNRKFHRLEQAISSARIANWELDPETNEMTWSGAIFDLLKIPDSIQEPPLPTLSLFLDKVHQDDRDLVREALMRVMQSQQPENLYIKLMYQDVLPIFVNFKAEVSFNPFDSTTMVVGMIQDMTDHERMKSLKAEKDLADKAAKLRQDFLARTSHEIRTPLNPILVLTKLLLDTPVNEQQQEYLEAINAAGKTLLAVVNDILDLSKIEAGKIDFMEEPFSVRTVLDQIEDMMANSALEKGLQFRMDVQEGIPRILVGDSVRLSQILLNLLSNAIKFTHEGEVGISVRHQGIHDGRVVLEFKVYDTGIGIPEEELESIFDSFRQVKSAQSGKSLGTGLGLTIVDKLIQLQGGKIEVDSKLGQGSQFSFRLEYVLANETSSDLPSDVDNHAIAGKRVLLAEDNPLNQLVTKKLLSDWGIVIDIASHGKEAIDLLERKEYDLVLMDLQMPIMDGLEATRHIRRNFQGPKSRIPIIAMTANAFTGADDECLRAGMDDYVSKPIEIANLYNKIVQYSCVNQDFSSPREPEPKPAAIQDDPIPTFEEMAKITEVDLSYLNEVSNGDADIMRMAIDKYLETTPAYLENLQSQLRSLNYDELRKAAHKLKSSFQFMGLNSLHQLSLMIETSCKAEQNMEQLPIWVNQITEGVSDSYPLLKDARDSL